MQPEPERVPDDVLLVGTAEWTARLAARLRDAGATVRTASTRAAAQSALGDRPFDCVVTGDALEEGTALDVVAAAGDGPAATPVVVCTDRGSEALAGEALAAGASDYVPLSGPGAVDDALVARIGRATRDRERPRSDRVRQFDALFEDGRTATWVLGPDGEVERINRTARDLVDGGGEPVTGTPFWSGPWWSHDDRVAADVRQVVRRAAREGTTGRVVTEAAAGADTRTVELAVHPVGAPDGGPGSLVVRGVDVSERASLHRELRASERLHRVTLNSMTDTVLVTDESGAFTYVCPNVNFVFGYSDEEVYGLGSIDELLGEDLFDRGALADEGVLTNVECAATDASGEEHTLLVNVREVDIGGGSILYSCRDITERKRREEAMTALQTTTRELLYAESEPEIARTVVEDATDILATDAAAFYLFRTDDGVLEPAAAAGDFAGGEASLSAIRVGDGTPAGDAFIEGESVFVEGGDTVDAGLESVAHIPLGDRGVLVAGSTEAGAFDDIRRELADLVAATAEAALERVDRENQLREQDRKLQRRNRELTRLDRINELIRGVDRALVRAETRDEIDRAVCETLTGGDRFRFAWVGAVDTPTGDVEPRAWAGEESGYLDAVRLAAEDGGEPAGRTAAAGETTVVPNVAAALRQAPWRTEALAREFHSVISVPLVYDEFVYGVLTVYADETEAFDEHSRTVFTELGRTVGAAISALERKNALLTASRTRLEFESRDESFVLLRLARRAEASLTFRGGVQQTGDGVALFVSVEGAPVEDLVAAADETVAVDGVRVLNESGGEGLVRLQLSGSFVALSLADRGAVLRRIDVDEESATVVVDAPASIDTASVVRHVTETLADTELVAKRTDDGTGSRDLYSTFLDRLTDRQLEVVQAAYYGGFFESPRESTGEEVAEALGISPPAFYRHNRTVQRKLFSTLFDDIGVPADGAV